MAAQLLLCLRFLCWIGLGWVWLDHSSRTGEARSDELAMVLARMREAAGTGVLASQTGEFLIEGTLDRHEIPGEYSVRFTPAGKFLHQIQGRLPESTGFNGTRCWGIDMSGMPRSLELFDREHRQLLVGLQTGQWLALLAPGNVTLSADGSDQDTVALDVRHGRLKGRLHVNRATWLPAMFRMSEVTGTETWGFSEYRADLGWKVPGKIVSSLAGGVANTYQVRAVRKAPGAPARVYDPVTTRPEDTHFDPKKSSRLEVKRARTGHILVRPRIDGQEVGWFIFDTGAGGTALDPVAAAKLKLTPVGAKPLTSFLGTNRARILRGRSFEIGPLTLAKPFFVEMDLAIVRNATGEELVGVVGYDILSRCVAEITLAEDSIYLHDPRQYELDKAPWQKLTLHRALPTFPATFEGNRKGLFRIDVGASGGPFSNVIFHASTVDEMQLLEKRKVTVARVGPVRYAAGTLEWFELAGHRFETPEAAFALDRQGPFGDDYVEGNLGVAFLKPFRIVLDYPGERVAFIRRRTEGH
jgi:hypothetical protein